MKMSTASFSLPLSRRAQPVGGGGGRWSWLDAAVVATSVAAYVTPNGGRGLSLLRLARTFRVLRLFRSIPSLRKIAAAVRASLPAVRDARALTPLSHAIL